MNTGDWIDAALHLVQAAAIIIGGVWAYYKFFKGRTFNRRAEVTVSASLITADPPHAIRARATLKTTGGSDIPLRAKILQAYVLDAGDIDRTGRARWREVANAPVFSDHGWLESQEQITDDVVIALPPDMQVKPPVTALRVTCRVYGAKRRRLGRKQEGAIKWTAHCVIPISESPLALAAELGERGEEP
jgi:hypothetical protein